MATTDKYKVNGSPINYSDNQPGGNNRLTTIYKDNGANIIGDKYVSGCGMRRAATEGYYSSSHLFLRGLDELAKDGTAVNGGNPDIVLNTIYNNTTKYQIRLKSSNNKVDSITISAVGNDGSGTQYTHNYTIYKNRLKFSDDVEYIKLWCAAVAGGGGGAGNQGTGGGAGGFAIFPLVLRRSSDTIIITVGGRGDRGRFSNSEGAVGKSGSNTKISLSDYINLVILYGGKGGKYSNYEPSNYSYGGGADLFGANTTYFPDYYATLLDCTKDDLMKTIPDKGDGYRSDVSSYRAVVGGGPGGVNLGQDGMDIEYRYGGDPTRHDYSYLYDYEKWWTTSGGGELSKDTYRKGSGGGASAFFGSYGGPYGQTESSDGASNGYLGGGGGSGASNYYGGYGGNGCVHLWIPGGLDSQVVLGLGDGGWNDDHGESLNYPSGKDVTDEVVVTFENVDSTHKNIKFSSSSIPSNISVKLVYKFKTVKMDTTIELSPYSVSYEGTLPHTDTYSNTKSELNNDIISSSAIVI